MKLKEMIPDLWYVVTKGGSTLRKGENIKLNHDGYLSCPNGGGVLLPFEWKRLRNEVEFNTAYYEKEIKKFQDMIQIRKNLIKKYGKERK